MFLLSTILALAAGQIPRCATPAISSGVLEYRNAVASGRIAARASADESVQELRTEHFFLLWTDDPNSAHRITGDAATVPANDSVPAMVRSASLVLERAWRAYVDTMGFAKPDPLTTSFLWNRPVPAGKLPVEICHVPTALVPLKGGAGPYWGAAAPAGPNGESFLVLSANMSELPGWAITRDLDGFRIGKDYHKDWQEALTATCVHELFHTIQFEYEESMQTHDFHEASALAMETRVAPESGDYMVFAKELVDLATLVSFPTGDYRRGYPHGWFVRGMMSDLGPDVVRELWQARKDAAPRPPSFLATLRRILPLRGGDFDTQLVRNAMRLALTGKRSTWHPTGFGRFPDAAEFPVLAGALPDASTITPLPLDLGRFQIRIDTNAFVGDRLMTWIPDQGVSMGWARTAGPDARVSWHAGSVRYSAEEASRSVWGFANGGNPAPLRAGSSDESSMSYWRSSVAPARTLAHAGRKMAWESPDGPVLGGMPREEGSGTPLLHLDIWKPSASKDPFGAAIASPSGGHAIVLEDADRRLHLSDATLDLGNLSARGAYIGSGNGIWKPVPVSGSDGVAVVALGDLDLSTPVRILLGAGTSPKANVLEPRPNPSRHGEPVLFPISGARGAERLTIVAADGAIVRELVPEVGGTNLIWDLRNRENRMVRPGVYTYVWSGTTGARRGKLLVAD